MADIAVVCMVLTRVQLSFVQASLFGIAAEVKNKRSSLREKTNKETTTTTKFYQNKTVRERKNDNLFLRLSLRQLCFF